jgi:hypothetical protein
MKLSLFAPAPDLIDELNADGFLEGPPDDLSVEFLMADIDSYSRLECEECGHQRHEVKPFHRGRQYRLVCVCRKCGNAVEV